MEDLTLNSGKRPKVNIVTTDDDGTETPHPFEVLPLTKPRYDAYMVYAKKALPLQKRLEELEERGEMPSEEDQAEATAAMIEAIDLRLRSTNGPTSVQSLWDAGSLAVSDLRLLGEYLQREATGSPPA